MAAKIMLVGEPMALFIAQQEEALENVSSFSSAVAGAEFNVAVGLSRLGHEVGYLTKLGKDPFGKRIARVMEQNGIDSSLIQYHDERATGFMMKSKTSHGDPDIFYFRKNSAASTVTREDIDRVDFSGYGFLHITGIFPALSETTLDAAEYLVEKAKAKGMTVSFDPNLRPQLWKSKELMISTLNRFAEKADYFLPGEKEGEILMGSRDPEKIAEHYLKLGVKTVIVKIGPRGAYCATAERSFRSPTFKEDRIVDTVGAGDGFAVGIISSVAEGLSLEDAVRRANAIGTIQIMNVGDNEGLPTVPELEEFMKTHALLVGTEGGNG
jgi:2-dehydro-3-deoxygluconokinase